jgi:hypothetical protein
VPDAGLALGLWIDVGDCLREVLEAVHHRNQDIGHAPVFIITRIQNMAKSRVTPFIMSVR